MIIKTANGSLMELSDEEATNMLMKFPYDYYLAPDACEVCIKESPTVQTLFKTKLCYKCYIDQGGTEFGWNALEDVQKVYKHLHKKLIKEQEKKWQ